MKQKLSISAILFFFSCMFATAQEWSKEDSLWLQNVLEGKETIKINEETKKAIEEGRLIAPSWLKDNDLKPGQNFDNVGALDSSMINNLDPYTMPPSVYALYVLYIEKMDSAYQVKSFVITKDEREQLEALLPTGTGSFYPHTINFYPGFTMGGMDFNHILSTIFSSHYRQLAKNRRNANAYKDYYDMGAVRPIQLSERERRQLNKATNTFRPSVKINTGLRRSGIDD